MASCDRGVSRRSVLQILAGGSIIAAGAWPAFAGETVIGRLIAEASNYTRISQRIDFISRALLGAKYKANPLIGGPKQPEKFVVHDDAFDCVTYCETVLAAAIAHDFGEFEPALRQIRYRNGQVSWDQRNHYFFEWSQHNVENKTCRPIAMDGSVEIDKTVNWHPELGKRRFLMHGIPRATFLSNKHLLANGDIVGFVTKKSNLDYFHTGFVAFGGNGELLLRHASKSRHRVLDERMDRFAAANKVRYVTLLRAEETAPVQAAL